ncbi:MAG: TetR/AcrR family transcriptional regulator [Pseudomonadota bacterium]
MRTWNGAVPAAQTQYEAKRQALLREAATCFTKKGYHGTSLTEIAETLGVSKAALYTYVKSKDELLFFCHQAAMDAALDSVAQARKMEGNGLEKLCGALRSYLTLVLSNNPSYVLILEEHALTKDHVAAIIARRDLFENQLRALVSLGMADGSVVRCDPKLAVFAALGMVNWVMKWYAPGGSWAGEQIAVELVRMLERMLSTQPVAALPADPFGDSLRVSPPAAAPIWADISR